jgi:hypothetical protein
MKTLRTERTIPAPPEVVWGVLADVARYPDWNPFLVEVRGTPTLGRRLRVTLAPPGGRRVTLHPRVTVLEPGATLEWLGRLGLPRLLDGRHRFELHPVDGGRGTRLVQREEFRGVLVPVVARQLDRSTRAGFLAMNEALGARAQAVGAERGAARA